MRRVSLRAGFGEPSDRSAGGREGPGRDHGERLPRPRSGGLGELPLYNEDIDNAADLPASASTLRGAVAEADAILVVTPEYNGSVPGGLKNAIDWLSRPYGQSALSAKPLAVVGASMGQYCGVWAHDETRKSFGIAGADVVDADLRVSPLYPDLQTPRSEHVLMIEVLVSSGTEEDRKRSLLSAIVTRLQAAGTDPNDVMVFFGEIDRASSSFGGGRPALPVEVRP